MAAAAAEVAVAVVEAAAEPEVAAAAADWAKAVAELVEWAMDRSKAEFRPCTDQALPVFAR